VGGSEAEKKGFYEDKSRKKKEKFLDSSDQRIIMRLLDSAPPSKGIPT
jgi:hypothetical protein